ncbi:unnamed protein product [Vicia faba]|uniref:Uncharacterized protein n=1 Tax=Vicia faba TaxID=3906 RepID=A0AAV0ZZ42_VICFA|nr:unnamed protein product [Vicia faba]
MKKENEKEGTCNDSIEELGESGFQVVMVIFERGFGQHVQQIWGQQQGYCFSARLDYFLTVFLSDCRQFYGLFMGCLIAGFGDIVQLVLDNRNLKRRLSRYKALWLRQGFDMKMNVTMVELGLGTTRISIAWRNT